MLIDMSVYSQPVEITRAEFQRFVSHLWSEGARAGSFCTNEIEGMSNGNVIDETAVRFYEALQRWDLFEYVVGKEVS